MVYSKQIFTHKSHLIINEFKHTLSIFNFYFLMLVIFYIFTKSVYFFVLIFFTFKPLPSISNTNN